MELTITFKKTLVQHGSQVGSLINKKMYQRPTLYSNSNHYHLRNQSNPRPWPTDMTHNYNSMYQLLKLNSFYSTPTTQVPTTTSRMQATKISTTSSSCMPSVVHFYKHKTIHAYQPTIHTNHQYQMIMHRHQHNYL